MIGAGVKVSSRDGERGCNKELESEKSKTKREISRDRVEVGFTGAITKSRKRQADEK
jgi:hypothetical protein